MSAKCLRNVYEMSTECLQDEKCLQSKNETTQRPKKTPSLFVSHGIYYYKITIDGTRKTCSTGCTNELDAINEQKKQLAIYFPSSIVEGAAIKPTTLYQLLKLNSSEETRPESEYGLKKHTARYIHTECKACQQMVHIFPEDILSLPLSKFSKKDTKSCRTALMNAGLAKTRPRTLMSTLKRVLREACNKGWIKADDVTSDIDLPTFDAERREALPLESIKTILQEDNFYSKEEYYAYYVMATTGMRKAEVACIERDMLTYDKNNKCYVLSVRQAFKDALMKEVGLPKRNKKRIIPLAKTTADRLRYIFNNTSKDIRFPLRKYFFYLLKEHIPSIREHSGIYFSCHMFRHSLESLLIVNNANPYLAGEYISWNGQDMSKVQYGYTHFFVKDLLPIANLIESLFQGQ